MSERKFCLSLQYNGTNSSSFVNATKIHQFKVKNSEIKPYPLYLGKVSKDFITDNLKKKQDQMVTCTIFLLIIILLIIVILIFKDI